MDKKNIIILLLAILLIAIVSCAVLLSTNFFDNNFSNIDKSDGKLSVSEVMVV